MNQKEFLDLFKLYLNQFPDFLKKTLQNPFKHIDTHSPAPWVQVLFYVFLTEAITQSLYNILTLQFSALLGGILFGPIQTIVVIAFLSFILWFVLDKLKYSRISYFELLKSLAFIEIITSAFLLPLLISSRFLKSFEFTFTIQAIMVLFKCYLLFRSIFNLHRVQKKKALIISTALGLFLMLPLVTDFFDDYEDKINLRQKEQYNEKMMEDSIRAIEEEFKK